MERSLSNTPFASDVRFFAECLSRVCRKIIEYFTKKDCNSAETVYFFAKHLERTVTATAQSHQANQQQNPAATTFTNPPDSASASDDSGHVTPQITLGKADEIALENLCCEMNRLGINTLRNSFGTFRITREI